MEESFQSHFSKTPLSEEFMLRTTEKFINLNNPSLLFKRMKVLTAS